MTSRERFLAALHGQRPDRTATAHVAAMTTVQLQHATGCRMPQAHHDPHALARLCAANHRILGFDAFTVPINFFNEPAAMGCQIDWGSETRLPMFTSHPWSKAEDAVVPDDLLDRPPVRTYLQALQIAKRDYGDAAAVLGKVMGPFSMVQVMHGIENTMMGLVDNPDLIRHFIDKAADALVICANAQFEIGIDALAIGEGGAGARMLSPKMYRNFLMDVHKRMIEQIQGPTVMHICGDITPRLELLGRIGLKCFNFDWNISPKTMKQASQGKFTVMGNICTSDLLNGRPEQIEQQVIENLQAGVDIVSPGCAISPLCPNENLLAISRAVRKWHCQA